MLEGIDFLISVLPDPLFFAAMILAVGFVGAAVAFHERSFGRLLCQTISFVGFTVLLAVAGAIPFMPTSMAGETLKYVLAILLKVVWWLTASWLLVRIFGVLVVFERKPSETRFLHDLVAGIVYVSAIVAIVAYVFDMPVSGVLAASGVIAIVLGLALQNTLGDVFSGIVLNIAKPYHPGDWVILEGGFEGRVVETNWRATQILSPNNALATVPNSVIAKGRIVNASQPTPVHGSTIVVRLEPTIIPSHGCRILEAALQSCNRLLRVPTPSVTVRAMDSIALEYELQFFVSSVANVPDVRNELFDLVYRHCSSAGVRLAGPAGSVVTLRSHRPPPDPRNAARRLLDHLPIFASLTDDERATVASRVERRAYRAGDILVGMGAITPTLSVLSSGAVVALRRVGQHDEGELIRLGPGDCFGEASVLSGEPSPFKVKALTNGVVYEISTDDLAPILKNHPVVAEALGQILARREALVRAREQGVADDEHNESLAERLVGHVRELFGRHDEIETNA